MVSNMDKNPSPSHWRNNIHVMWIMMARSVKNADNPMNHVGLDLDNLELTVSIFLISLAHISHPTTCWIFLP